MAAPRGSPLLPVHSMKHGRKRSGGWGGKIVLVVVLCLTVVYGLFAINYVGKSSKSIKGIAPGSVDGLRTLAQATAEESVENYEQLSERMGESEKAIDAASTLDEVDHTRQVTSPNHQEPGRQQQLAPGDTGRARRDAEQQLAPGEVAQGKIADDILSDGLQRGKAKAPVIHSVHSEHGARVHSESEDKKPHASAPVIHTHEDAVRHDVAGQQVPVMDGGSAAVGGLYTLEATDIDGKVRKLSEFSGKVAIVVNVASACGYTDENYKGLMETYRKYQAFGLEILGFPCNQFGNQESGAEPDIKSFCTSRYHVTFPMFSKVEVNGPNAHPVYKFLKTNLPESEGGGGGKGPGKDLGWNFFKFLVNKQGMPMKLFPQTFDRVEIEHAIYKLLHE